MRKRQLYELVLFVHGQYVKVPKALVTMESKNERLKS
jgi:hypothetical protein